MAEEQQGGAQNKLGQLYVELGAKGLPDLTQNLNILKKSFLGTTLAANQLTKPINEIIKESGNGALSVGKLNSVLGMAMQDTQRITTYLKSRNLDTGLINDIESLQTKFYDFSHGFAPLDANIQKAFNLMGLSVLDYNGDLESTLKLIDDVQNATKNLSKIDRAARLRDLGLNREWAYAFDRPSFRLSDSSLISDNDIKKEIEAQEAEAQAKVAKEQLFKKIGSKTAPIRTTFYKGAEALITNDKDVPATTKVLGTAAGLTGIGSGIYAGGMTGTAIGGPIGAIVGGLVGGGLAGLGIGAGGYAIGTRKEEAEKRVLENNPRINQEWSLFPKKVPILEGVKEPLPPVPQGLSFDKTMQNETRNYIDNRSYTINNTNNINGENAQDVAYTIMKFDEAQLQRNQFEKENLTGI